MDRRLLIVPFFALAGGCVKMTRKTTSWWRPNPFAGPAQVTRAQTSFPQANVEIASRVDQLGRKIIAANPRIGLRPLFCAIGSQNEEIFHQGGSKVIVTRKVSWPSVKRASSVWPRCSAASWARWWPSVRRWRRRRCGRRASDGRFRWKSAATSAATCAPTTAPGTGRARPLRETQRQAIRRSRSIRTFWPTATWKKAGYAESAWMKRLPSSAPRTRTPPGKSR